MDEKELFKSVKWLLLIFLAVGTASASILDKNHFMDKLGSSIIPPWLIVLFL